MLRQVQTLLSQKAKTLSRPFIAVLQSIQNFTRFEKKDQRHSLDISEVTDPDKCVYFNDPNLHLYNTLRELTYSRVPNTAETCTPAFLC